MKYSKGSGHPLGGEAVRENPLAHLVGIRLRQWHLDHILHVCHVSQVMILNLFLSFCVVDLLIICLTFFSPGLAHFLMVTSPTYLD